MRHFIAACICQTLHVLPKENAEKETAIALVQRKVAACKAGLDRNKTLYRILEEKTEADGSVLIRIIKRYNQANTGNDPD